eukprot:3937310-Rhodomonas_salina.3
MHATKHAAAVEKKRQDEPGQEWQETMDQPVQNDQGKATNTAQGEGNSAAGQRGETWAETGERVEGDVNPW